MRNELVLSRQKRNNTDTEREQNQNQPIHSNQRSNQLTYRTDDFDQRRTNSPKSPFNSYGSLASFLKHILGLKNLEIEDSSLKGTVYKRNGRKNT